MISGYYYLTFKKRFDIGKFSGLDDKWLLLSNFQPRKGTYVKPLSESWIIVTTYHLTVTVNHLTEKTYLCQTFI